jgi:hypothetical protein
MDPFEIWLGLFTSYIGFHLYRAMNRLDVLEDRAGTKPASKEA